MTPRGRLLLAVLLILSAAAVAAGTILSLHSPGVVSTGGEHVQNFVIIASSTGFNESVDHGVPANPWPVIHVAKGTLVNFTVYNEDKQAHGFNVSHYFDNGIETVAPGQKVNISFMADETGTFRIYCAIFCTVHWAMQSGELIVS